MNEFSISKLTISLLNGKYICISEWNMLYQYVIRLGIHGTNMNIAGVSE